eukprot:CAMPEP_0196702498 /NCGR_PEP_ID=MMETSP1090-20130531/53773_1 /TAXON_ID=37098 /ORGANISM="Isochrysis sp, Strain CCMP1244" /LENGTH=72 /DNA_ID=CAMNT_0042042317 /DNA_START=184 /DNA_END=398 /DNA_ORIENTATION=+
MRPPFQGRELHRSPFAAPQLTAAMHPRPTAPPADPTTRHRASAACIWARWATGADSRMPHALLAPPPPPPPP